MTRPGYGTVDNPLTLSGALSDWRIQPGHTIYLRGGRYSGQFTCNMNGASGNPITIKSYPGERAIIDGSCYINGSYQLWEDIEFCYSGWTKRQTDIAGSGPSDIPSWCGVDIHAAHTEMRHCIVHDVSTWGIWVGAVDALIYGCLIYNIGWASTADRGHGHLFYSQNDARAGRKTFKHNVALASFSTGIKMYTSDGMVSGYDLIGNTVYNSGALYGESDQYSMNYWMQAHDSDWWKCTYDFLFERNRSYHVLPTGQAVVMGLYDPVTNLRMVNNYWPEGVTHNVGNEIVTDTGGYYGPAVGNAVFIEPDDYDTGRAIVTIYNQAGANTVDVDLTAVTGLSASDTVSVRNAQDYFNDLQTLTLDANKIITVNMQAVNRGVEAPIQWTATATTFPAFGCFIVQK